ncbi:hypothetical protein MKZ17_12660 [Solibacillus sp. FSL R7-0682]|uniref:hypothetical protein n=1 Tax=Solibacillus sp. FSL R7-0682 TaxID=2921690 RepID=UPI0030FB181A
MKSLLNKGLLSLCAAAFIFALSPAFASASEVPVTEESALLTEYSEISPMWVYTHTQTITHEYSTASNIPDVFYYEYYHETFGMMRGSLKYVSHKAVKGKYVATFTGTMYSNPL